MKRLVLLVLVAGCSSSTPTSTAPATGSLSVTVTAPVATVTGLTVTGPNGYAKSITATTQLTGLAPGSYAITAQSFTTADPIVATAYQATVTGSPATVSAGGTATSTVSYATRPGSGALWVVGGITVGSNTMSTAIAYTAAQLHATSSVAPSVALSFPVTNGRNINVNEVAFDGAGNLWVVNDNTSTIVEYSSSSLGAGGSPTPTVTLQLADSSVYWLALAFDAKGDLWAVEEDSAAIVEFTPDQLAASGSPTPAVTLRMGPIHGGRPNPLAMAFDGQGSMWLVDGSWTIVEYTASQLTSSGTLATPAVQINSSVAYPYNLAFDQSGNLWLAHNSYLNNGSPVAGHITELAASSLKSSGTASFTRTLNLPTTSPYLAFPVAIAFDDNGDLWYSDITSNWIAEFTAAQLMAGGNPSPAVTITSTTPVVGVSLAFDPHATSLPLH
ncbi:MAG TPA: hypothetical protein VNV25_17325 [Gemmatimonadaceae bacterium]|nr:hypothetical protein [Gemmatimonadaceae bacterium]